MDDLGSKVEVTGDLKVVKYRTILDKPDMTKITLIKNRKLSQAMAVSGLEQHQNLYETDRELRPWLPEH